MSPVDNSLRFSFRPLTPTSAEIMAFACLYAKTYRRQFFEQTGPLQGALGAAFPVLEKYEDIFCFYETTKKLAATLGPKETSAYAFVATEQIANVTQFVGLVKGGEWTAGDDMKEIIERQTGLYGGKVAELGSIYVDPAYQSKGVGLALVRTVAREALDKGYRGMITRAYEKNTSPRFFVEKTGATAMGACRIPYGYRDELLKAKGLAREDMPDALPGLWFFWDQISLQKLAQDAPMRDKTIKQPRMEDTNRLQA